MHDFLSHKQDALLKYLRRHIAGEVRFDETSRKLYSTDASHYQIAPLGVVIPRTPEDLQTAVQIALEMRIPIVPRGGGTSLSGQSIGSGLVIDCSKYLNQMGEVDATGRKVWVQPGVVLDHLNQYLAKYNLLFGPDVATSNRATLGGMLGNNSAGSRSIYYGKTGDHVHRLKGILSDGSPVEFASLTSESWTTKTRALNSEGAIYREVQRIITQHGQEIDRRFPKIVRRVSGYNLAAYVPSHPRSLVPLLIGSEGTLTFLTEAELNLVPKPKHRGLLVPHFDSLKSALDALAICLEFHPSAVELVDSMLIELARTQRSMKHAMQAITGHPAALLMIEFSSDDAKEVTDQVEKLRQRLQTTVGLIDAIPALEIGLRDALWNMRSAAVPLLYGMTGDRKPITFVEDTAVTPERLPEFALRFREVLQRHGTDGCFYGHASVGCLHIRPVLNLKQEVDRQRMGAIMVDITDLVLAFGGSLSGEHGDGLVRSEWNRKMFGPVVYEAFEQIKKVFDPHNLLNPGKVVHAPSMMENHRTSDQAIPISTIFDYSKQEGFFRSIELCNGAGVCRKTQGGAMCPSYRATREERDSTRGRANALRLALSKSDDSNPSGFKGRWLFDVMDLCLSCKACKSECPSNVDMAKLKSEFLHTYYESRLRPLEQYLMANIHRLNRFGSSFARISNWLQRQSLLRWMLEKTTGIDRRRSLPKLHSNHLRRWMERRPLAPGKKVLLWDDCFTTYNEPQIGRATVEVLEQAGFAVELVQPICCGRAMISKGFLHEARELVQQQLPQLASRIESDTPILGLEPSCVLTLLDEWPELVPGPLAQKVAKSVYLVEDWLAEQIHIGSTHLPIQPFAQKALYHGHCHQKALVGVNGTVQALHQIPELNLHVLDAGCCGMAGAFGYEKDHYDLSVQIANLSLIPSIQSHPEALVIASGTSCRHQIHDLTGKTALHPMEVIHRSLQE